MKEIELTQGKVALVDDEDYPELSKFRWYAKKDGRNWYALRNIPSKTTKSGKTTLLMHRQLLGPPPIPELTDIDHDDWNGLNNQRANLAFCTHSENKRNCRKYLTNTSGYTGVSFDKVNRKWMARLTWDGKEHFLGLFDTPAEASAAVEAARKLHWEEAS